MLKNLKSIVSISATPLLLAVSPPPQLKDIFNYFEHQGYHCTAANNPDDVWDCIRDGQCEAIIIDAAMPDNNGVPLYTSLRVKNIKKPVIVLIPEEEAPNIPLYLNNGADSVVTVPVHMQELEARVLADVRLSRAYLDRTHLSFGGIDIDLLTHIATADGKDMKLSPMVFALLARLMKDAPNLVPHAEVEKALYSSGELSSNTAIRIFICTLRKKLAEHGRVTLQTVPHMGYRLAEKPSH